jgi:ubiquinone/menaquinone biosynthesis C-methylase UbiE
VGHLQRASRAKRRQLWFSFDFCRGIVLLSGVAMASKRRTHRIEKLARIYDDEILPVWSQRFGRMLLRDLELSERSQILDVACGTGYPATEVIRRLPEGARLIAIDGSSAMLDVARKKIEKLGVKNVFVRSESAEPKLSFADDVYDVVICNLGVAEMADPEAAIADFARVTKPNGEVRVTLPVEGSYAEFFDIYKEVLIKHDKHEALQRLESHIESTYPSVATCEAWMRDAGLESVRVDVEEFTLLFRSSREFFFAPVIEYGPLAQWKEVAGAGQEMQDVFWYIKEAIDAYFDGRAFQITIKAGCLVGTKVLRADEEEVTGVTAAPKEKTMETEEIELEDVITAGGSNGGPKLRNQNPFDEEDPPTVDTFDVDTADFGGTLEGLPYVKPLGDVEDTMPPSGPGALKRDDLKDD